MSKPHNPAAERNQQAILAALKVHLGAAGSVLEIGAGSGQHAVYCGAGLPHLIWQASDLWPYVEGIRMWTDEAALSNVPAPIALDVARLPWPAEPCDAVFGANVLHYMAQTVAQQVFAGAAQVLNHAGQLIIYGPFNYNGAYISEGNQQLDAWLRSRHPDFAIRDFVQVERWAHESGFELRHDIAMPANNRLLIFGA